MPGRGRERLSAVIKEKTAHFILHEIKDPRLGFVTVTRVKLAPDLSTCRIFYSVLGEQKARRNTHHALLHSRGYLQRRLGETVRTRIIPHIEFEFDESIEGAMRVTDLLRQIEEERPAEAAESGADEDRARAREAGE